MVGRYCVDNPDILKPLNTNFSRKPEFEHKRHFKPNNTIWVQHNGVTLYVLKCGMSGDWHRESETPFRPPDTYVPEGLKFGSTNLINLF